MQKKFTMGHLLITIHYTSGIPEEIRNARVIYPQYVENVNINDQYFIDGKDYENTVISMNGFMCLAKGYRSLQVLIPVVR